MVTETFVRLYDEGLIYRGKRLVNWDPVLKSAVSDLEVESEEEDGFLWLIRYPLVDGTGEVVVATTRPETMLGDVAVMVHPEDERYAALVGKMVRLPLCERDIPVIADDYVDRDFGTGVVKVTPAHDANDYAVGQRHGLPLIGVLALDATVNDQAPQAYRGLDRFVARKKVVADLEAQGLLVEVKKHKLMVPRCARTGQIVEPMLTDQWFVATTKPGADGRSIAQKAIDAVESGEVKFVPEQWVNTYNQWMKNIQDWCISRQLWWGHQIPAWYGKGGELFVARSEDEARAKATAAGYTGALTRDEDVLDTWYSSALVPFSTLGWPAKTIEQDLFLPTPTARRTERARHRLRHHLLLGRPDDHDDHALHGPGAVQARLHPRPGARRAGPQDEQVRRQRARPGGPDRRHRTWRRCSTSAAPACASPRPRRACARTPRRNSPTASPATAPMRCASPSPHSPAWVATSASTASAARATATSATSCGTPRASC